MSAWEIEVVGTAREVYRVHAETEDEARDLWHDDPSALVVSEVENAEVSRVREIAEDVR